MTRDQAISTLVKDLLPRLTRGERESHLLGWWFIDASDAEHHSLPKRLRDALVSSPDGPPDPENPEYDPLLRIALQYEFIGVTNTYLERRLLSLGQAATVTGAAEAMQRCPCCGYLSLQRRGEYDICGVCFWEDDGTEEEAKYSSPNHQTLGEARLNFERLGAVEPAFVDKVLPDGKERFSRGRFNS